MDHKTRIVRRYLFSIGTLQAEADDVLHDLLKQTHSDYAGFYVVKVDNSVVLLDFALVGEEQSYTKFRTWLDSDEEDITNDDMVKKLVPMLERTRRGCFNVSGKILPAYYF